MICARFIVLIYYNIMFYFLHFAHVIRVIPLIILKVLMFCKYKNIGWHMTVHMCLSSPAIRNYFI